MRPSLLPGLLAAARRNLARGAGEVRLFEVGRRYLADGERPTLGLVLAANAAARLAERQGGRASTPLTPRRRRSPPRRGGRAGRPAAVVAPRRRGLHPGRSGRLRSGRRQCSPNSARSTHASSRPSTSTAARWRRRSFSTPCRRSAAAGGRGRLMRRRPSGGDARLRLRCARGARRRPVAARDPWRG